MKYNLQLTFQYGLTIFLSAFLLFQVQPLIGKMILPWFGGSASVWTTCMLFFQATLLLGYIYSHWIVKALSPYRQSILHIALLLISLSLLPLTGIFRDRCTTQSIRSGRRRHKNCRQRRHHRSPRGV